MRRFMRDLANQMQEIAAVQAATTLKLQRRVQANSALLQAISAPVQVSTAQGGKPQDCPLVAFGEEEGDPAAAFRRLWTRAVLEGGVGVFGGGTLDAVKAMVERQESDLPEWMGALGLEAPLQGVYEGEHSAVWAAVQAAVDSVKEGMGGYAAGQKRMRARVRKFMDNATGIVGIQKVIGGDAVSRSASGRRGVDHCNQVLKGNTEEEDWIAWYKPKNGRVGKESFAKADIEALHAANFAAIGVLGDGQDPPLLEDLLLASLRDAASGTRESKTDKLYSFVQVGYNAAVGPNPRDSGWGDLTPPDLSKERFHTLSWAHLQLLLPFIALAWLDARRESLRDGRLEWVLSRMTTLDSAADHAALMARLEAEAAPQQAPSADAHGPASGRSMGGGVRCREGTGLEDPRRTSEPRSSSSSGSLRSTSPRGSPGNSSSSCESTGTSFWDH